jgi:hypothetical protein
MFLREQPALTVAGLFDLMGPAPRSITVPTTQVSVDLLGANVLRLGGEEVPATPDGIVALGDWLDIPTKFLGRLPIDLTEGVINGLLVRNHDDVLLNLDSDGLVEAIQPDNKRIDPRTVVEIAHRVVGPDGLVVDWRRDNTGYGFDVTVGGESLAHIGGDPAVGDITRGGVRFGQDTKHNLAPWVQPYTFRLACTNGMEIPDHSLKINARGMTTEDIMESLEENAFSALGRVRGDIDRFYELRTEEVRNPEQTLVRLASEHGLPDRTLGTLLRELPEYLDTSGNTTMFDIVNLVTNLGNQSTYINRFSARRNLEVVGGSIAYDHTSRCPQCASKL